MRVQTRLYGMYGALLLSAVIVGAMALWSMHRWQVATEALSVAYIQNLRAVELRGHLLRQIKEVLDALVMMDPDADVEMQRFRTPIAQLFTALQRDMQTVEERQLIRKLAAIDRQVFRTGMQIFRDIRSDRWDRARGRMERDLEQRLFPAEERALAALTRFYRSNARRAIERAMIRNRWVQFTTGIMLVLVFLQGLTLFLGIQRWLVQPLRVIHRATSVISTGDLAHRVPIRTRDEFGELAASINRMAAALRESQDRLVRTERLAAVGELTAYIAHNIRNPLASIRSAAQLGLDDLSTGDLANVQEALEDIVHVVDKLDAWVHNLLTFTRPLVLRRRWQDVRTVLREVIALLKPKWTEKRLRVTMEAAPDLPTVYIDAEQLEQAIAAVITNAIEASPVGAPIRLAAWTDTERRCIRIAVHDAGGGIRSEWVDKVFAPYFTTKVDGVGLGLTMAKKIVEAHGGDITIASQEGRGTTVTINLPLGMDSCPES